MKKIILLFLILTIQTAIAVQIPVEVVKVIDGDTIKVKIKNNKFSIRLTGIDCPETSKIHRAYKQAYIEKTDIDEVVKKGVEAKVHLENLYKNSKTVSFEFEGIDKYARALGVVWFDK